MRERRKIAVVLFAAVCGLCVGCDQIGQPGTNAEVKVEARVPAAEIPPGELSNMAPVNVGGVEMSFPLGWTPGRRGDSWLVETKKSRRDPITSIRLHAEDYAPMKNVTTANQAELVTLIQQALAKEITDKGLSLKKVLTQPVEPIAIGDFVGVHYVRQATAKSAQGTTVAISRLFLVTVVDGRKVSVELHVAGNTVRKYRPQAHAVAASLKFASRAKANTQPQGDEEPAKTLDAPDEQSEN